MLNDIENKLIFKKELKISYNFMLIIEFIIYIKL